MANVDSPSGLRPVMKLDGGPLNAAVRKCFIPATDTTAMFINDPVALAGSSDTEGKYATVVKATAGSSGDIYGVIVAFEPNRDDLSKQYRPASTARYCYVIDGQDVVFEVQEDSAGTALAATNVGAGADLVYTHTGSTASGISGAELDRSTIGTGTGKQLTVLGLVDRPDNAIGDSAKWLVKINRYQLRKPSAGV